MRIAIAVVDQVQRPFAQMLYRLGRFTVVAGECSVNEIEERYLLDPLHFPASLEASQIDGAQIRVSRVPQQGMVAKECQFIVPGGYLVGWEGEFLPNRV